MAKILPLVLSPDPLLEKISKPVEKIDDNLRLFLDDMLETMYHESGIGLAAVQVGRLDRILVMDINYEKTPDNTKSKVKNSKPLYLINPEIIELSEEKSSFKEGCLSFPGALADVVRPKKVKVKYTDYYGNEKCEEMDDILAICVQHEMDHLNGITFVDHLSRMKKQMIIKKMLKARQ